jgi:hypothetical protein
MNITTKDPIAMEDVTDIDNAPFVIEGSGPNALKIYFLSEENKAEYLAIEMHGSENTAGLSKIFNDMADNPNTGSIN